MMSKFITKHSKTIIWIALGLSFLSNVTQLRTIIQYSELTSLSSELISLQEAKIARLECQLAGIYKN